MEWQGWGVTTNQRSLRIASRSGYGMTNTDAPAAGIERRHDLDALRAFAMLLGIVLHGALAFIPGAWVVSDASVEGDGTPFALLTTAIHGFRMPLFFLMSGFFTAMLWRQRGLRALVRQRVQRLLLPLAIAMLTVIPLMWVAWRLRGERVHRGG